MTGPAVIDCACRSEVGRVRERNEDVVAAVPERGWAILADGMGGYVGGEIAARLGVEAVLRRLEHEAARIDSPADAAAALARAVDEANGEIRRVGHERPELAAMGSTLVAAVFVGGHLACAHVGDSRLYRYADGALACLTRDHTVVQEQVDAGVLSAEDARRLPYRGMLTRGLGVTPWVEPDLAVHPVKPGELYLLCSDGLTDMLDEEAIARALAEDGGLEATADRLVALANARGGRDNISLILARVAG